MRTLAILVVLIPHVFAQHGASAQQPRPTFSSRADLVVLHVTVVDDKSRVVGQLPREAFRIFEDGVAQAISFFQPEDSPATVGFVIDGSSSMVRKRDAVIAGGLAFAAATHPDDEVFSIHFNERVWFGLPPGRAFTSDTAELRAALLRSTARGRTAVVDAVAEGLAHVERGTRDKKALIVISDGGDNASRRSFPEVLASAQRSPALIYTICLAEEYDEDADPETLERLARATGGEAFAPRKIDDVTRILERIARDLHSGYTIGYTPAPGSRRGYRALRVEVDAGGRGALRARARTGYVALD